MSEYARGDLYDFYARGLGRFSLALLPLTAFSAIATAALVLLEFALLHSSFWPVAVLGALLALLHAAVAVSVASAALAAVRDLRRGILGQPTRVITREWLATLQRRADARVGGRSWRIADFLGIATPFYPVGLFAVGSLYGLFWSEAVQQLELQKNQEKGEDDSAQSGPDGDNSWLSPAPRAEIVRASRRVLTAAASRTFDLAEVN